MKTIYRIPHLTGEDSEIYQHLSIFLLKIGTGEIIPAQLRKSAYSRSLVVFRRFDLGAGVWQMVDKWKAVRNIDVSGDLSPSKLSRIEKISKYSIKQLDAIIQSMDMAMEKRKALIQDRRKEEEG